MCYQAKIVLSMYIRNILIFEQIRYNVNSLPHNSIYFYRYDFHRLDYDKFYLHNNEIYRVRYDHEIIYSICQVIV